MKTELKKLDSLLKEKRPDYYVQLNEPLSEEQISALETKYSIQLPADLKELYRWKNGQNLDVYSVLVNGSYFEPLEKVLSTSKEFTAKIGDEFYLINQWNKNWLPIFCDGGGSRICYDLKGVFTEQKGELVHYLQGYTERQVLAPSLLEFLAQLVKYYEETPTAEYTPYFDITDRISQWNQVFFLDEVWEGYDEDLDEKPLDGNLGIADKSSDTIPEDLKNIEAKLGSYDDAIRNPLLEVVLKEKDETILEIIENLLGSRALEKRLAGLELLAELQKTERSLPVVNARMNTYFEQQVITEVDEIVMLDGLLGSNDNESAPYLKMNESDRNKVLALFGRRGIGVFQAALLSLLQQSDEGAGEMLTSLLASKDSRKRVAGLHAATHLINQDRPKNLVPDALKIYKKRSDMTMQEKVLLAKFY